MSMKAKRKIQSYITKSYRRIRHRGGHGVHSPFAYSLITQVINEDSPYYAYRDILSASKKNSLTRRVMPNFINKRRTSTKVLFLLYRLVNRFKSRLILEIGKGKPISMFAVGLVDSNIEIDSIQTIGMLTLVDELNNSRRVEKYDFVLIHSTALDRVDLEAFYKTLKSKLHSHSVIVIKGIHRHKATRIFWSLLKTDEDVRVCVDLYELGLAINHDKLNKQNYIVSF